MITKTVNFLVDEATNIAVCGDAYFVFEGEVPVPIEVKDALARFVEAGVKIPGEFVQIRDAIAALL